MGDSTVFSRGPDMSTSAPTEGDEAIYDVIIRGGSIYDGSGAPPFVGDVGVRGDAIVDVAPVLEGRGQTEIDAHNRAVAPGFINMLSQADQSLIVDGRSQSDIRQGVTFELFGEGWSLGPLSDAMKHRYRPWEGEGTSHVIDWTTLDEGLQSLVRRGVACNVGSVVGATSLRIHEIGYVDRPPTSAELDRMCSLLREAMQEGAFGVGSALGYAPAAYADTSELVALATVAAEYGGMYLSHLRSEGGHLLESIEELIEIAQRSGAPSEIWHFKAAGRANWHLLDAAIDRVERAHERGLRVTADVYPYHASSTGLEVTMPHWVQEGGPLAWFERLKDPAIRSRIREHISRAADLTIVLVGFRTPSLRPLIGQTVEAVARERGTSIPDTIMDLVVEDESRVEAVFFTMSEDGVRSVVRLPWVSFCSDSGSLAPEGAFLASGTHPRAYGSFARLLARYVRDDEAVSLAEAVRRLTSFPADNLGLERRGRLTPGHYADLVVIDPQAIQDHATFELPHRYATGVQHVFVNGVQVLRHGEHTDARPGRVVRGQGYRRGPR
jgi:N-acyl-D-aspartate/D-glutamate deacylase